MHNTLLKMTVFKIIVLFIHTLVSKYEEIDFTYCFVFKSKKNF